MKIGIPKGLLYCKYHIFAETFFQELGAEIITSPDTNRYILDMGIKYCVDEACLPIKIFHGHVAAIKDKCDIILIPRIMQLKKNEFICPKFCGLPEMILNDIPNMPKSLTYPVYAFSKNKLRNWALNAGLIFSKNLLEINKACKKALLAQETYKSELSNIKFPTKVALVGHPYNLYDSFTNMNIVKKLNKLKISILTEETIDEHQIDNEISHLFKKPFWTFAKNSYGFSTYLAESKKIDGIIYISSFACGIDSIVIELIKDRLKNFPFLVLKIDEQTGEAGFDTRIEAFSDMLERRCQNL
ncbi:acyl-CoA dehydratase activase-related protein [Clostridium sp. WILCCON 0269]|uniref:Acyl-CoA dehydratase activase-related protein n=1 Tax=Candidatus Clostridium eludens TaxID=3381663 RepID=A0ABW8SMI1_9CLOT